LVIKVKVASREFRTYELRLSEVRVVDALRMVGLDPDESDYLVIRGDESLDLNEVLRDGDEVTVVEVPSGG